MLIIYIKVLSQFDMKKKKNSIVTLSSEKKSILMAAERK
jgi:hypothetical protein